MAEIAKNAEFCDFISGLPQDILCKILEKLSLDEAVRTGVLSHRWRDLWKHITIIELELFTGNESLGMQLPSSLTQFVNLHQGENIERFSVKFNYTPDLSAQVDSWVLFANNKHVRELFLDFDVDEENVEKKTDDGTCYQVHPSLFTCESLINLELRFCALKLPSSIRLSSLKIMTLDWVDLADDAVEMLTSNSTVEKLSLVECNRTRNLRIHVAPNGHFRTLMIYEDCYDVNPASRMEIEGPGILELFFMCSLPRAEYIISNMSERLQASIILDGTFIEFLEGEEQQEDDVYNQLVIFQNESCIRRHEEILRQLLATLQHAAELQVCEWCIRLLSLSKMQDSQPLSLYCTNMEITTCFEKWDLPGIIYTLKSCPKLEHLVILTADIDEMMEVSRLLIMLMRHDFEESSYLTDQIENFEGHFKNLKTLHFKNATGQDQSRKNGGSDLHEFRGGSETGSHLLTLVNGYFLEA